MGDDELLFAAAVANPLEDTPRLALADWFDEHCKPDLAAGLRAEPKVVRFLADLIRWDIPPFWRAGGNPSDPRATDTARFSQTARWLLTRFRSHFSSCIGASSVFAQVDDAGMSLMPWVRERSQQITQLRERAAREAASKLDTTRIALAPVGYGGELFEYTACLFHELVIRQLTENVTFDALEREMRMRAHPLAWLPPRLLLLESEVHHYLPRFTSGGDGYSLPENAHAPLDGLSAAHSRAPAIEASEIIAEDAPMFAAVRGWVEESNGRLEGMVFGLDRPLVAEQVGPSWFARLPAESLGGAGAAPPWSLNRRTPAAAFAQLFAAAHTGGAYGRREFGAYGRLHAWRSFGALAGCELTATVGDVSTRADRCQWLTFSGTDWFDGLVDIGLMCVRPGGRSIALLAASDID